MGSGKLKYLMSFLIAIFVMGICAVIISAVLYSFGYLGTESSELKSYDNTGIFINEDLANQGIDVIFTNDPVEVQGYYYISGKLTETDSENLFQVAKTGEVKGYINADYCEFRDVVATEAELLIICENNISNRFDINLYDKSNDSFTTILSINKTKITESDTEVVYSDKFQLVRADKDFYILNSKGLLKYNTETGASNLLERSVDFMDESSSHYKLLNTNNKIWYFQPQSSGYYDTVEKKYFKFEFTIPGYEQEELVVRNITTENDKIVYYWESEAASADGRRVYRAELDSEWTVSKTDPITSDQEYDNYGGLFETVVPKLFVSNEDGTSQYFIKVSKDLTEMSNEQ